jgi:hypothetical protein
VKKYAFQICAVSAALWFAPQLYLPSAPVDSIFTQSHAITQIPQDEQVVVTIYQSESDYQKYTSPFEKNHVKP